MPPSDSPTLHFYGQLQRAYDHFNAELFDGRLPPCLITLRSANRHFGYHHHKRFVNAQGHPLDELGLHPGFIGLRSVEEVLSTLVHEMVHHWQQHFGRPTRTNPHNREWAARMRAVGLEPSSTGLPAGKATGTGVQRLSVLHPSRRRGWSWNGRPHPCRRWQRCRKGRHCWCRSHPNAAMTGCDTTASAAAPRRGQRPR